MNKNMPDTWGLNDSPPQAPAKREVKKTIGFGQPSERISAVPTSAPTSGKRIEVLPTLPPISPAGLQHTQATTALSQTFAAKVLEPIVPDTNEGAKPLGASSGIHPIAPKLEASLTPLAPPPARLSTWARIVSFFRRWPVTAWYFRLFGM